jgi:hypothetical protein
MLFSDIRGGRTAFHDIGKSMRLAVASIVRGRRIPEPVNDITVHSRGVIKGYSTGDSRFGSGLCVLVRFPERISQYTAKVVIDGT